MRGVLQAAGTDSGGQRGYHLMWCCALEGVVCLGPRLGKQQTFVLLDEWVAPAPALVRDEALARLARRYFAAHGPASRRDFAWWSGLGAADASRALELTEDLQAERVGDGTLYVADSGLSRGSGRSPAARLLPAFDEYLVGYADRSAVLQPAHTRRVNNGGGLLAPTMTLHARVVGTWKRTLSRQVVRVQARLFDAPSPDDARALEAAAAAYGRFLGLTSQLELREA